MKKLTNEDRIEIIRRLAVMDRNMVIGVAEVAVLHNTTIANVHQACSPARIARGWLNLHLPQRVQNNGRRVGWIHGEVRDLLSHRDVQADAPIASQPPVTEGPKKRMGRKRSA